MKLKFIYPKKAGLVLRLDNFFAIDSVFCLESLQIDVFDGVFAKSCKLGDLLVGKAV